MIRYAAAQSIQAEAERILESAAPGLQGIPEIAEHLADCLMMSRRFGTVSTITRLEIAQPVHASSATHKKNALVYLTDLKASKNTTCAICMGGIAKNTLALAPNGCDHAFHKRCIFRWFVHDMTCPICRISPKAVG
jgi:Ring finger domain